MNIKVNKWMGGGVEVCACTLASPPHPDPCFSQAPCFSQPEQSPGRFHYVQHSKVMCNVSTHVMCFKTAQVEYWVIFEDCIITLAPHRLSRA
jgi:hypothetical protein